MPNPIINPSICSPCESFNHDFCTKPETDFWDRPTKCCCIGRTIDRKKRSGKKK